MAITGQAFLATVGTFFTDDDDDGGGAQAATLSLAPLSLGNQIAAATLQTHNPITPATRSQMPSAAYSHTLRVGRGDTLNGLLVEAGLALTEAGAAVGALRKVFDPRSLKPGQEIDLTLEASANGIDPDRLLELSFLADYRHEISLTREGDTFSANKEQRNLEGRPTVATGTIQNSLFESAVAAGVPIPVLMTLIRAFSFDVDFQRDIHPGDRFEVMFEGFYDGEGAWVHEGKVDFAALTLGGRRLPLYLFTTEDGEADYYDAAGRSVRKALLRTPVDGARLSSGFGKRMHPILGYSLMHKGVDFAAPEGTPIYAAGSGTIAMAGRNGAYGNYIRITHTDAYSTAYAHMSRFARDMGPGKKVSQGQIIGYIGATGRATGPHLHFEVLKSMAQINPMSVQFPSGRNLDASELAFFKRTRKVLDDRLVELLPPSTVAQGAPNE